MQIEAEIKSLKKILTDDELFYQIPDYQRPYSWDNDNVEALIDDLVTAFENSIDEKYFCGSLVLVKNKSDNRLDIIDGQQRITTFTILACVIRDYYGEALNEKNSKYIITSIQDEYEKSKRKLKFLTSEYEQIDFEHTVLKKIDFEQNSTKTLNKNRYLKNAITMKNILIDKVNELNININYFVLWLYESVVLTVITCPNQDTAIQIFNVLNNRGMPLSSTDILKSSLMQKLSKEDRKIFKAHWESINISLTTSEIKLDLEFMLTIYMYYKITTNPKSRLDKELLNIFNLESKSPLEIIKEIKDFSVSYIELMTSQDKIIYCLRYLRHRVYWSSILTCAIYNNYPEIKKLKEYLLSYYYQNWIAGATVARIKQTSFNILRLVKEKKPIESILKEMRNNISRYKTNEDYEKSLNNSEVYGLSWDKPVLLLIEYYSSDESKPTFISINNKLQIEHILPRTGNEYWDTIFNKEQKDLWCNSLANLTLLSLRKNCQATNASFIEKKKAYKTKDNQITSFLITQEILDYDEWTTTQLKERKIYLLSKLNKILNII
ncbi:DUF262 domain-containing protein [Moellerella wisconsensis]|uniref:DUF262 domain-containing protein n=1 Tax=Moellerella wisconsensis ATCC 35017 TaxID=1354267 RepID=A0A0N1KIX9_9GAMM|nr:DUF262 domain-containing protein [Moellerella wisconsensis]KPD03618.1 hypothetical protein M992_0908 [Moellerella wisconsensis ATCC 35017]VFS50534.1 Uncharacterized conserved protein [Moellerella wisconsensis]